MYLKEMYKFSIKKKKGKFENSRMEGSKLNRGRENDFSVQI